MERIRCRCFGPPLSDSSCPRGVTERGGPLVRWLPYQTLDLTDLFRFRISMVAPK